MRANPDLPLDVVGVGNAIVDVLVTSSDEFVTGQGLKKGSMALIDADRAKELYGLIGSAIEAAGGSAANTMAGIASFGGHLSDQAGVLGQAHQAEDGSKAWPGPPSGVHHR